MRLDVYNHVFPQLGTRTPDENYAPLLERMRGSGRRPIDCFRVYEGNAKRMPRLA